MIFGHFLHFFQILVTSEDSKLETYSDKINLMIPNEIEKKNLFFSYLFLLAHVLLGNREQKGPYGGKI